MVCLLTLALASFAGSTPAATAPCCPRIADAPHHATAVALLAADTRRIRAMGRRMDRLLADGVRRSTTFADLVTAIHATDVIVYVEPMFDFPPEMAGRLLLQAVTTTGRYLRVQVRATLPGDQTIAVIAHELRHALEVAGDASVVDEPGLIALYRRIGHVNPRTRGYDTDAATLAGLVVRDELSAGRTGDLPSGA